MIRRRFINKVDEVEFNPDNYLTIEALEDGLTASLSTNACKYSTDGVMWTSLTAGTDTPAINTGERLYFKATGLTPTSSAGIGTFTVSKQFNLSGNCMSMLFGDRAKSNLNLTGYDYAFVTMFYKCTKLKSVSAGFLPATTLAGYCYQGMFSGCTGLTTSPELPATTLADYCYQYMFQNCSRLTTSPELPATTLADYCYSYMFYKCTGLTTAPEILPATTLANRCYYNMFYNCTGLTTTPKLPATTLANECYSCMFFGTNVLPDCINIDFSSSTIIQCGGLIGLFNGTKVTDSDLRSILPINPDTGNYWLPVTTLSDRCYSTMFSNCTELTTSPELPATTLADYCYSNMFYKCTGLTTAPELPATTLANSCYSSMFSGCTGLTTAPELPATTLADYCYDSMFYNCTGLTTAPELPATTLADYCYDSMFYNCTGLTTAPEILPATTLADYCYDSMFYNCTGLTTAPEILPATTLADYCYDSMFYNCTGLTTAPDLPATTLADYCYFNMFYGCSSLTTAPEILPAITLAYYCYGGMFNKCSSLTTAPELPAMTLESYCYSSMFKDCTSLVTAPELPAMTLVKYNCYAGMFQNCSKLNYIKAMFTTKPGSDYTRNWVSGVASTGTFVKNAAATWDVTGVNGVPEGWTITTETEGVKMIEFTIGGTSYQAEEGMTWGEWVESEYNTGNFFNFEGNIKVLGVYVFNNSGNYVQSSDIISETNYITHSGGTN